MAQLKLNQHHTGNGLALNRWQAIILNNNDLVHCLSASMS